MPSLIVVLSEVLHIFGLGYTVVFTCYVIRHEVHHHLQASLMGTLNESLPLAHAFFNVGG